MARIRKNTEKKISNYIQNISSLRKQITSRLFRAIDSYPLQSFLVVLFCIVVLTVIGTFLRKPKTENKAEITPISVQVYSIGSSPKVAAVGTVEKSGHIEIVAQSPGVVQYINAYEGTAVYKGQVLLGLSSTYGGGSIPGVARQIAQKNYEFVEQNYTATKDMIKKRREIAGKVDGQADAMRDITSKSIEETKTNITFNEELLSSINDQITEVETNNTDGSLTATLNQLKQAKSGMLSAISALKSGLRNAEYMGSSEKEPARLSDDQRELTLKQLDIEEKSTDLNKELSLLNLRIAQLTEALMYPSTPVHGTVERVHVQIGQSVNPGTPLVTLVGNAQTAKVVVYVNSITAQQISHLEKTHLMVSGKTVELYPLYVSTEPTKGSLHTAVYALPAEYTDSVVDGESVRVQLPIGQAESTSSVPFVPLDSIFQTQSGAYVYVASASAEGKTMAVSRSIHLGDVYGSYVQVESGLSSEDQIILNRSIVDGDSIVISQNE